jgi:galactokinase
MTDSLNMSTLAGFEAAFGGTPSLVIRAPGRVNLIGEHTDYNDGFAMPAAIGLETQIAIRLTAGHAVHVAALDFGEDDSFVVAPDLQKSAKGGWRDYVRGSLVMLARAGFAVSGAELAIAGSIPKGTGLSSSASLEVAVILAMLTASGQTMDAKRLALLAQSAENDFVGMRCGNLDQLASAATEAGAALLIDCRSLDTRQVSLPDDVSILIVQSGVTRGLVEGEYNRRRAECEEAARLLGVAALRDADLPMLDAKRAAIDPVVFRRARHVITDNQRTLEAARALDAGDLVTMGKLMRDSHVSQRDDFEITTPETDELASILNAAIGAEGGARQTGGGFGGAVVALLRTEDLERVQRLVVEEYRTPAGHQPILFVERARAGAGPL